MPEAWLLRGLLEGKANGDEAPANWFRFEAGARGVRCSASRISASLGGPPGVDILCLRFRCALRSTMCVVYLEASPRM